MAIELSEYYTELMQGVLAAAQANQTFAEDEFFDHTTQLLVEAGELEGADRARYSQQRGIRVDGYGGDPLTRVGTEDGVLSLIALDFAQSEGVASLTATDMNASFRRLHNYLNRSLDPSFRVQLEESSPAFGLSDLIAQRWDRLSRVRFFLISNRDLSARVDGLEGTDLKGTPISYSVWDLSRMHRFETAGSEREDIVVDLSESGGPLLALPAHMNSTEYQSYMAVLPGRQLASIYDRWGTRLLEQNVRVFLQTRGKVNRGIRNTIELEPDMFFAYNNGITATAEGVELADSPEGKLITSIKNFQIVNGGQTTASIHAALRNKEVDLDRVSVQMKLSIVDADRILEVVPKISRYANTQNRVTDADFFANHPYHVRIEDFSRRLFAPTQDGSFRESKWFYERARGQYNDARGYLTASQRNQFDLQYPKNQVFTKTDLAKFENVWRSKPEIVSRGAQKNFAEFATFIGSEWNKSDTQFNELYYQTAIAKAIIFREVERIVSQQPWYQGGYRANIVAYAIAKLGHEVQKRDKDINFETVWRAQQLSPALRQALTLAAKVAHDIIVEPPSTMRNVTEWAKQQACWSRVSEAPLDLPTAFESELQNPSEAAEAQKEAVRDQRMLNGIEAQTAVANAGSEFWRNVNAWGDERQLISPDEKGILTVAMLIPTRIPSEKQSQRLLEILSRLQQEGFPEKLEDR